MRMHFTHPNVEAKKQRAATAKAKRERENQTNLRRIATGMSGPQMSSRIAPYGLNRPHEVADFPYLAHNGPKDESPKEKCISIVTGDRVPEKFEKDYIWHREYAEQAITDHFKPFGASPLHFDIYALELKDGVYEWRGRGAFGPSTVWDLERFPDIFGRFGAALAARGLYANLRVEKDCNLICDATGKITNFRGAAFDYDFSEKGPRVRFVSDQSIKVQWQQTSFGKWIDKAVVVHDGDVLPPGKGARYAERLDRYSKLKALDYRPHTFAVYNNDAPDKSGTQFYAIGKDMRWHHYGHHEGNTFVDSNKGYVCDGFGDLPGSLTAEQLAFIDCRLAAQGFEFVLVPTEGEEFNEEAATRAGLLSLMWGNDVSIPEEVDFG
ncbi:MAG: hypothetical protein J0G33_08145 [Afipia felis]|nr:hypothetical protein [Afipia felis]